jgi:hypothetical protein
MLLHLFRWTLSNYVHTRETYSQKKTKGNFTKCFHSQLPIDQFIVNFWIWERLEKHSAQLAIEMSFLVVHELNLHEIAVDTPAVGIVVVLVHSNGIDVEDVANWSLVYQW